MANWAEPDCGCPMQCLKKMGTCTSVSRGTVQWIRFSMTRLMLCDTGHAKDEPFPGEPFPYRFSVSFF